MTEYGSKVPTILMFKPTDFELVPEDKLEEWEEHLREDVGLDNVVLSPQRSGARGTTSRSGRPPAKDDCDVQ